MPPARAEVPAESPIDRSVLRDAVGGDAGKELEFLRHYCRTVADDLEDLGQAQHRGDGTIAAIAHRMRGAALPGSSSAWRESPMADVSSVAAALRRAVARTTTCVREFPA